MDGQTEMGGQTGRKAKRQTGRETDRSLTILKTLLEINIR